MCSCSESDKCNLCGLCPPPKQHEVECDACDNRCDIIEDKACTVYVASNFSSTGIFGGTNKYTEILKIEPSEHVSRYIAQKRDPFDPLKMRNPGGLVWDRFNNLYVTDLNRGYILKIKPDLTTQTLQFGQLTNTSLYLEIETTDCGDFYVADYDLGIIYKIACDGLTCTSFVENVNSAFGLAYDNEHKKLYATTNYTVITVFNDDGSVDSTIDFADYFDDVSNVFLGALAFNNKHELLVADYSLTTIYKISLLHDKFEGPQVSVLTQLLLSNPLFMDVDKYDNIYITSDSLNDKIMKIHASGFQTLIDVPFAYNTGVAVKKWQ